MIIRNIAPKINKKQSKRAFEKRLFKVLVGGFTLGILVYIYSLGSVVFGVVERRNLDKDISNLNSQIAVLEQNYIEKTSDITLESGKVLGYLKADNIYYESQERVAFKDTKNTKAGF